MVDRERVAATRRSGGLVRDFRVKGRTVPGEPMTALVSCELIEFHGGAFKLAVSNHCPVAPIVVNGTWPIYRGWRVLPCPGTITVRILEPIAPEESGMSAERLRLLTFERIKAELSAIRGTAPASAVRQTA